MFAHVCRDDAPNTFRRYWEYTLPIRKFMAGTSEEAVQVRIPHRLFHKKPSVGDAVLSRLHTGMKQTMKGF